MPTIFNISDQCMISLNGWSTFFESTILSADHCNCHVCFGGVAQLGERLPCTQEVIGSIPIISTKTKF